MMDAGPDAFRPLAHALDLPENFDNLDEMVHNLLYNEQDPGSVISAVRAAFNNATILRPELGTRLMQYLELAMAHIEDAARHNENTSDRYSDLFDYRDISDDLLAFWGGIENSPADPAFKALLFLSKYVERIDLYTRFALSEDYLDAPLRKLATYTTSLATASLPESIAEGMRQLASELPLRGYTAVEDHLCQILGEPGV